MPNYSRYFLHDFKAPRKFYSINYLRIFLFQFAPLSFYVAAISFYWFLVRPLISSNGLSVFNPHFYLVILWGVSVLIAFVYIWLELKQAFKLAFEARQQKEDLGQYLFEVESVLQEMLPELLHKGWPFLDKQDSKEFEYENKSGDSRYYYFRRRPILWELYDWCLDMKSQK